MKWIEIISSSETGGQSGTGTGSGIAPPISLALTVAQRAGQSLFGSG